MVNVNKLKAKFVENNLTQRDVAKTLGINEATLNRKINDQDGEALKIIEAMKLITILNISNPTEFFLLMKYLKRYQRQINVVVSQN